MARGQRDSSKTRVRPVFDALWNMSRTWLPDLLMLPRLGVASGGIKVTGDLTLVEGHWEPNEQGLDPPVSLLSWLIRNLWTLGKSPGVETDRAGVLSGDFAAIANALRRLRSEHASRAWWIFEGVTYPDVLLIAPDALVVIEGKRTESGPTTRTSWLLGRQQIWRHLDAAWEIRGKRAVYGFFIVEGDANDNGRSLPAVWREAVAKTVSADALAASFPHRSADETQGIAASFLGATTWQQVCDRFGLDRRQLPETVDGAVPNSPLQRTDCVGR